MSISKTYTYLGKLKGPQNLHLVLGEYNIAADDQYLRATKCVLDFPALASVQKVLALHGDLLGNTSNLVALSSISGNIVTFAVLEGSAATGQIMAEKTNAEAYGQAFTWYCLVAGS